MLHAIIDFAFADVTCLLAQGNPSNGAVLCTNENRVTSVCTFSCSAGYDLVGSASTTCLNDGDGDAFGVWSNTRPFCIRKFVTVWPAFACFVCLIPDGTVVSLVPFVKQARVIPNIYEGYWDVSVVSLRFSTTQKLFQTNLTLVHFLLFQTANENSPHKSRLNASKKGTKNSRKFRNSAIVRPMEIHVVMFSKLADLQAIETND